MKYSYTFNRNCSIVLLFSLALMISACDRNSDESPAVDAGMVNVDWVLYEEQEPGSGQYPVRMLVSRQYLRFDDNDDASDFLLLDRGAHKMFSVNHEEQSILVIGSQSVDGSLPSGIVLTEERNIDAHAPKIAGQAPLHVRFKANGDLCYEAFVIPGIQVEMAAALTEYFHLLGRRQLQALETVPAAMRTPCFLSRYVYQPARHLSEGLPVREWDAEGYQRTLVDFGENRQVSRGLFELPESYSKINIDQASPDLFSGP